MTDKETDIEFDKRFDVDYPMGRFDLSLNLMEGNSQMYCFFGSNIYYSIYKLVDEKEQKILEEATQICLQSPDTHIEECIHIASGPSAGCYIISMQKSSGYENSYDIELFNATGCKSTINALHRKLMLARNYLTLNGEALFTYYPASLRLHLFFINRKQTIDLFDMNIDDCKKLLLEQKRIDENDLDTFETFCSILKEAKISHSCIFHGCILSDKNVLEKYRVSFRPAQCENGETIVSGTWAVINEITSDVETAVLDTSYLDGLTGLLNKKSITKFAENAVNNAPSNDKKVALAMMDIDNFKSVNDNFGHLFGDKVIKAVAEIIQNAIGTDAVAGRMGGDEFLIVFEKYEDELEYRNVLRYIKMNVQTVYRSRFGDNPLTCSIGLGRYGYGPCSTNYHDLFRIADRALYLAKQKGRNRYIIYKPELHGDFNSPDDSGDIVKISNSFYSDTDMEKSYSLLSDIIITGPTAIPALLDCLAHTLMLDRINVFVGNDTSPRYQNKTPAGTSDANPAVLGEKKYMALFVKNMLVISNLHVIEFSLPNVYRMLRKTGVSCMMQFILRDSSGNTAGLVSADVFNQFSAFPKIATQLFENACRTVNSVLIRDKIIG